MQLLPAIPVKFKSKAGRPHPLDCPHTPPDYRHTMVKRFNQESLDKHTNKHANGRTDGWKDGHYQLHFLPLFAVDNYEGSLYK